MKTVKYHRTRKTIRNLETDEVTTYESINQAKRASHALQLKEDGALGRGSLTSE